MRMGFRRCALALTLCANATVNAFSMCGVGASHLSIISKSTRMVSNMSRPIDGNLIASQIRQELKESVDELFNTYNVKPGICIFMF